MSEEKRKVVKVGCTIPNGITLRLFKPGRDEGAGRPPMVQDGRDVTLNGPGTASGGTNNPSMAGKFGETEVDAEWFLAWLEQNETGQFVTCKMIYVIEDEQKPEGDPADDDVH